MEYFTNLFGGSSGNNGGLAYTLGNNGNGSYVVSNGSNSYTYGNAADAAAGLDGLNFGTSQAGSAAGNGLGSGLSGFLSSDTLKGLGTIAGIGSGVFNIINSRSALKQAERAWEAENARANEIMAMNREKYNTYKADKARLNSQYVG